MGSNGACHISYTVTWGLLNTTGSKKNTIPPTVDCSWLFQSSFHYFPIKVLLLLMSKLFPRVLSCNIKFMLLLWIWMWMASEVYKEWSWFLINTHDHALRCHDCCGHSIEHVGLQLAQFVGLLPCSIAHHDKTRDRILCRHEICSRGTKHKMIVLCEDESWRLRKRLDLNNLSIW